MTNQPETASAIRKHVVPERDSVSTSESPITRTASPTSTTRLASGDENHSRRSRTLGPAPRIPRATSATK